MKRALSRRGGSEPSPAPLSAVPAPDPVRLLGQARALRRSPPVRADRLTAHLQSVFKGAKQTAGYEA